jgi:hypothetical protein
VQNLKCPNPRELNDILQHFGVKMLEFVEVCFYRISQNYSAFVSNEMISDLQIFKSRKTLIGGILTDGIDLVGSTFNFTQ